MSDLGRLRRDLLSAGDTQVVQVVAMVDRMPDRGAADALIAPLRPRLAVLRPCRMLSFTRLLFLPLDPLIVPAPGWRPPSPGIPRPVLAPLAGLVRAALGDQASTIDRLVAGRTTDDAAAMAAAGQTLWPAAAAVLRESAPPTGWAEASGLPDSLYDALVRPIAALLAEGAALHRVAVEGDDLDAEGVLRRAAGVGPAALAMALALLLTLLPGSGELLLVADDLAGKCRDDGRMAAELALEFLLNGAGRAPPAALPTAQAAEHMRRAALLLETMTTEAQTTQRGARAARVAAVRRRLDDTCRERFAAAAEMLALPPAGEMDAIVATVAAAEAGARDLRRLDAIGRRLGDGGSYDRALQALAMRLSRDPQLARMDKLRLAEILLGPEAALALLA